MSVISDLTNTKWFYNNTLLWVEGATSFAINYSSNGQTYDTMTPLASPQYDVASCFYSMGATNTTVYNSQSGGWTNTAYRTITITGGADVTDSVLIEWLQTNATQVSMVDKDFDITALSGYSAIGAGQHSLGVRAAAASYLDSDLSNTITFNKLAAPNGESMSGTNYYFGSVPDAETYEIVAVTGGTEYILGEYPPVVL